MEKVELRTCVGCGCEYSVLNVGEATDKFCTQECKEEHSIFNQKQS